MGSKDAQCDVLVVGGGLVGVSAAMFLAQQGLQVTVAERHDSISVIPKARNLSVRTMELFRENGIEDAVRAAGDVESQVAVGDNLAGEYERIFRPTELTDEATQSPVGRASCEQYRLEPIVRERCEQLGVKVLTGHRAVTVTQDADSVTVEIALTDGTEAAPMTARYAVIADGANGTFREALGIGRHGEPYPGTGVSIQFDADVDALIAGRPITAFISPKRDALLFLQGVARDHHLLALPPRTEFDGLSLDSTGAQAVPLINAVLGSDDVEVDVLTTGVWHTGSYVADKYRVGRVFLVGDAAHINSPHGGYGANTGIAEAHNLAWKIAAVVHGDGDNALLDTYESERLPITEYTVLQVREMAKSSGYIGEGAPGPVNVTLGFRYPVPGATGYNPQTPVEDPADAFGGPGTRVPHVALTGDITSTVDLVDPHGFVLLAPKQSVYVAALQADPVPGVMLQALADDRVADARRWQKIFPDPDSGAVLIRPDGVVAARFETVSADPRQTVQEARARALRP